MVEVFTSNIQTLISLRAKKRNKTVFLSVLVILLFLILFIKPIQSDLIFVFCLGLLFISVFSYQADWQAANTQVCFDNDSLSLKVCSATIWGLAYKQIIKFELKPDVYYLGIKIRQQSLLVYTSNDTYSLPLNQSIFSQADIESMLQILKTRIQHKN